MTRQRNPALVSVFINRADSVDFPVPPFIELNAMVFILSPLRSFPLYRDKNKAVHMDGL
jgi:hypothetical protein